MADKMHDARPFSEDFRGRPSVRGFLHRGQKPAGTGLVLTHGASGNCRGPLLVMVATAFAEAGFQVLRCDLPYRQARATGPPSPTGAARDRAGLEAAVEAMRRLGVTHVTLAGISYGGRQASMLAAEKPLLADALLLLSYPLHPPGKPSELRVAHLPEVRTPAVFVHGSRDPFGAPDELERALALIPAPTTLVVIEGAGHDLSRGRKAAVETHREVATRGLAAMEDLEWPRR
jgi:uncharacterized protein